MDVRKQPRMEVVYLPIEQIMPYERNPRKNQQAVPKVAESLRQFGWKQPIVVDGKMRVVVGETRLLAARMLGFREAPVVIARDLTRAKIKAYRLADNRTHEEAEWDQDLLSLEIADLRNLGVDLSMTGFGPNELNKLALHDPTNAGKAAEDRELSDTLKFQVVVECEGEKDQVAVIKMLRDAGCKCRPIML